MKILFFWGGGGNWVASKCGNTCSRRCSWWLDCLVRFLCFNFNASVSTSKHVLQISRIWVQYEFFGVHTKIIDGLATPLWSLFLPSYLVSVWFILIEFLFISDRTRFPELILQCLMLFQKGSEKWKRKLWSDVNCFHSFHVPPESDLRPSLFCFCNFLQNPRQCLCRSAATAHTLVPGHQIPVAPASRSDAPSKPRTRIHQSLDWGRTPIPDPPEQSLQRKTQVLFYLTAISVPRNTKCSSSNEKHLEDQTFWKHITRAVFKESLGFNLFWTSNYWSADELVTAWSCPFIGCKQLLSFRSGTHVLHGWTATSGWE